MIQTETLLGVLGKDVRNIAKEVWDVHEEMADVHFLRRVYGLDIRTVEKTFQDHAPADFEGVHYHDVWLPLRALRRIVSVYPPNYTKNLNISEVRVVNRLRLPSAGTIKGMKRVSGFATRADRRIYLSPNYFSDAVGIKRAFHHELEHIYNVAENWEESALYDEWQKLHKGKNLYIGMGSFDDMNDEQRMALDSTGFANAYGRVNAREDKATVAEELMSNTAAVLDTPDAVLKAKIELTIDDFISRSGGAISRQFFEDLAAGKVGEDYWGNFAFSDRLARYWGVVSGLTTSYRDHFSTLFRH